MNIDELTLGQLREVQKACGMRMKSGRRKPVPLPFKIGDAILIRTVTMIDLGRVVAIGSDFITLTDGGWVAETGRFSEMLKSGKLNEFERCDEEWFLVGRGSVCDVFPWKHPIPKVTI
jgi:hypothetical protein